MFDCVQFREINHRSQTEPNTIAVQTLSNQIDSDAWQEERLLSESVKIGNKWLSIPGKNKRMVLLLMSGLGQIFSFINSDWSGRLCQLT
jgi:hypothetical protein